MRSSGVPFPPEALNLKRKFVFGSGNYLAGQGSHFQGYGLAAVFMAAAFLLRIGFDGTWGDRLPFGWFFLAVLLTARFAGSGPQIAAGAAGLVLGDFFFMRPRYSLWIAEPLYQVNAVIYCGIVSLVIYLAARAREQAKQELVKRDRIAGILQCASDAVCTLDADWKVTYFNKQACELTKLEVEKAVGRNCWQLWPELTDTRFEIEYRRAMNKRENVQFEERHPVSGRWIEVNACPYGKGIAIFFRDVTSRNLYAAERDALIKQLQSALAEVKTLSGMLPICAQCKKIRDDGGYWNQIEAYIGARSNAKFTHGLCPDCMRKIYPQIFEENSQASPPGDGK